MSTNSYVGGNDPDTQGRAVPPYEGRRETADVDPQEKSTKDDAQTAGATGPVTDPEGKAAEPTDTARGAVASPADEQPAEQMPESEKSDPGVGPAHVPGTPRGEDLSKDE
jgi:hypothetical protein